MPAAASHAADTIQPERLRDGSLLFRFSGPDEPAHGQALSGRSSVATLTSVPSAPAEALGSAADGAAANGAATDGQRRSKQSWRDREPPQRQSQAGRDTQPGRQGTPSRAARGGSTSNGAGQLTAGQRNGAGRGSVPAQGRASARQNGSAAPTAAASSDTRGNTAAEPRGQEAAEPRPSFMDIPPPQQQYRSMRAVSGASDSSAEGDDAASAGTAGRLAWKTRGQPQRVRAGPRIVVVPSPCRRLSTQGLCCLCPALLGFV